MTARRTEGTSGPVSPLLASDWPEVRAIYVEGLETGHATFEAAPPSWESWDASHLKAPRLVAREGSRTIAWAALSPVSRREVYAGVGELSIYVRAARRGEGVGSTLLGELLRESGRAGIWTVQAAVFPENSSSLALLRSQGFRDVGRRERLGKMTHGPLAGRWRDVLLLERRSAEVGTDVGMDVGMDVRKEESMDRVAEAVDSFRNGCACSQAVLAAFSPAHGMDRLTAMRVAAGFAGGMRLAETCGAVTGAFMVLGLARCSTGCEAGAGREPAYQAVKTFASRFQERHGSLSCRNLLGCDISTPEGAQQARERDLFRTVCPELVRTAASLLEDMTAGGRPSASPGA